MREYNIQFKGEGNSKREKKEDSFLFLIIKIAAIAHFVYLKYDVHTCRYK